METKTMNEQDVDLLSFKEEDVEARYNVTETLEVVKCRNAVFLHCNGFWVVSKPTMANNGQGGALYQTMLWLCDTLASGNADENVRTLVSMMAMVLTLPLDCFADMHYKDEDGEEHTFFMDVATAVVTLREQYYTRIAKEAETVHEETEEDLRKNAEFYARVNMAEEARQELKELAAKEEKKKR